MFNSGSTSLDWSITDVIEGLTVDLLVKNNKGEESILRLRWFKDHKATRKTKTKCLNN